MQQSKALSGSVMDEARFVVDGIPFIVRLETAQIESYQGQGDLWAVMPIDGWDLGNPAPIKNALMHITHGLIGHRAKHFRAYVVIVSGSRALVGVAPDGWGDVSASQSPAISLDRDADTQSKRFLDLLRDIRDGVRVVEFTTSDGKPIEIGDIVDPNLVMQD